MNMIPLRRGLVSSLQNPLFKALGVVVIAVIAVMLGSTAVKAQGNPAEIPDEFIRQFLELYSSGKYEQAIPIAKKLLEATQRERGPTHPDTALSLNNLAELYRATGAYAKAEPLCQHALAIREKALGPTHPDTAQSLNNLAALYDDMGPTPRPSRRTSPPWRSASRRSVRRIPTRRRA
jgi:tetratricopeptide (TPR) repeat protein